MTSETDLPYLYNAADVFILAAREVRPDVEGFGLVLLEASACATPVVATRSGGVADAIVHGETGCLVAQSSEALAGTLTALLLDPAARRRMGLAGRAYVLRHATWRRVAERLLEAMSSESHEAVA